MEIEVDSWTSGIKGGVFVDGICCTSVIDDSVGVLFSTGSVCGTSGGLEFDWVDSDGAEFCCGIWAGIEFAWVTCAVCKSFAETDWLIVPAWLVVWIVAEYTGTGCWW